MEIWVAQAALQAFVDLSRIVCSIQRIRGISIFGLGVIFCSTNKQDGFRQSQQVI